MSKPKIKWKVQSPNTGRSGLFIVRGWPRAFYNDENQSIAARIESNTGYSDRVVKQGTHQPLRIYIADHSCKPWQWYYLVRSPSSLQEAKAMVEDFISRNPEYNPTNQEDHTMSASQRERQLHHLINEHVATQLHLSHAINATADTSAQYEGNLNAARRKAHDAHDALKKYVVELRL